MPWKNGIPASKKAEYAVTELIRRHCGIRAKAVGGNGKGSSPFDVLTERGVRVEVKDSKRNARGEWYFNIVRHGRLDERQVDAYVFTLRGLGKRVFVVVPAPVETRSIKMTLRTLVNKWSRYVDNWGLIAQMDKKRAK
jgi:hypothetical protein